MLVFGVKGTERKGKFKLGAERAKLHIARKKFKKPFRKMLNVFLKQESHTH